MKEETRRHLAYLDGWRGLAIGCVLLGHFWLDAFKPGVSTLGVDFFFVLSGRLMAEILFLQRAPLPTFFIRRFSRVYPGLFVFILLTTVLLWPTPYGHSPLAAASGLTFTLNYAMLYVHRVAVLDHLWSLCVEEHGYVLLALAALAVRRWAWPAAAMIGALGLAALANGVFQSMVLHRDYFDVFWRTDVQVAPLFISGALFLVAQRGGLPRSAWISPAAFVGGVAAKLWGGEALISFGLGTVLLALSVATVDQAVPLMKRALANPWLGRLGLWSYSLYLWQQPFYKLHRDDLAPTVVLLAGAFAAALLSFYFVERPARTFINGLRLLKPAPAG